MVSLFYGGVVDEYLLEAFSTEAATPGRFAGVGGGEWSSALADAARVGLLTGLNPGFYQIHPALPSYLAAEWQAENPQCYGLERQACERGLCAASASFCRWLTGQIASGDAPVAYALLGLHQRTFGAMLGCALDRSAWPEAEGIVRALDAYWGTRGLSLEATIWADRILGAVTDLGQVPFESASSLWTYTIVEQALRQRNVGQLDQAVQALRRALAYVQGQPLSDRARQGIGDIYHNLGMVDQDRMNLDEAEDWYRKAFAIEEEFGDRSSMASTSNQLGNTAYLQGRLDEAEDWYRRSLSLKEETSYRPGISQTYHQLGMVAHERGRLDEAENWYRKALAISEELGDRPSMAITYHELGRSAQRGGRRIEAEGWYRKSLAISEELGNRFHMAATYHELGNSAYFQGRLDEADGWYRKSLAFHEQLNNRPGIARVYGQLGLVAEARAQPRQALEWVIRCASLFNQFPHPATGPCPAHLAWLTGQLGTPALEETWHQVTGQALPQLVREYVTRHQHDEEPAGES